MPSGAVTGGPAERADGALDSGNLPAVSCASCSVKALYVDIHGPSLCALSMRAPLVARIELEIPVGERL